MLTLEGDCATYLDTAVLEALEKHFLYSSLVFSLDDTWGCGKHSEGAFTHACVGRLAGLEQGMKQLDPCLILAYPQCESKHRQERTRRDHAYQNPHIDGRFLQ